MMFVLGRTAITPMQSDVLRRVVLVVFVSHQMRCASINNWKARDHSEKKLKPETADSDYDS